MSGSPHYAQNIIRRFRTSNKCRWHLNSGPKKYIELRVKFRLHFAGWSTLASPWNSWRRNSHAPWTAVEKCSGWPGVTSANEPRKYIDLQEAVGFPVSQIKKSEPPKRKCLSLSNHLRKRQHDTPLKFDTLSGFVRGGGARPPGAFLFLSPWSLRSPALLPSTAPGSSKGDLTLKTVSKGKLKLYPSLEIFFRLSNSNTTRPTPVPHPKVAY